MSHVQILGIKVNNLTFQEVISNILAFIESKKSHQVITANSLMINQTTYDDELKNIFLSASLVISDSWGVILASKILKNPLKEKVSGIDLMVSLCQLSETNGYKVYLLGSKKEILNKTKKNLLLKFPNLMIAGVRDGFFRDEEEPGIISEIRNLKPDILFVGFDVPRQEKWIYRNLEKLSIPVVIGVGGSFDVISGVLKRAPIWMRKFGFEWFYRFLQQPWRIKRIIYLPVFMLKVIKQKITVT